jgi:hypothetical protein
MFLRSDYKPEFDSFKDRLIELAQIRQVGRLLERVVSLLRAATREFGENMAGPARRPLRDVRYGAAVFGAGCLSSVGGQRRFKANGGPAGWSRVDGDYSRIPLGVGKVGRVGATGEAIVVKDFAGDPAFLVRYRWAAHSRFGA